MDLHVHSYYSDGTQSSREILDIAKRNQVGIISITDHNQVIGTIELMELSKYEGIKCLTGVEIDVMYDNKNIHLLAYGFDVYNHSFREFISDISEKLEGLTLKLVEKLSL